MEKPKKLDKKMENLRKKQLDLANKYKDMVLKKYKDVTKSVILFGSLVRGDFHDKSDIDMLVIIDDTLARFTPEMKERFDDEIYDIAKKLNEQITVQPAWTLTEFWDMARIGHPLLYTIVRDGWALYDTGFFIPVRKLLELGKIPTTLEAVEKFMETSPQKINRVETAKLYMVAEDLYYSMLNSSQAVLMYMGLSPPSPKHTPMEVDEQLVKANLLERNYLDDLVAVIDFRKRVEHKEIKDIGHLRPAARRLHTEIQAVRLAHGAAPDAAPEEEEGDDRAEELRGHDQGRRRGAKEDRQAAA
jgi:predicted nucleotidyltransferase